MYLAGLACCADCSDKSGLSGLGQWEAFAAGAANYFMSGNHGGQTAASAPSNAPPSNVVSTTVATQVSPQISPTFVQQDKPENSAVTVGTSQSASGPYPSAIPQTGYLPGFDTQPAYAPSGSIPMPQQPAQGFDYKLLLIPAGILGIAVLFKKLRK